MSSPTRLQVILALLDRSLSWRASGLSEPSVRKKVSVKITPEDETLAVIIGLPVVDLATILAEELGRVEHTNDDIVGLPGRGWGFWRKGTTLKMHGWYPTKGAARAARRQVERAAPELRPVTGAQAVVERMLSQHGLTGGGL